MRIARLIVVLFLILGIVFAYSPFVRGEVSQVWEATRPGVILLMDGVYTAIRNLVAGTDAQDGIHDHAPEVDFEEIITMKQGVL